MGQGEHSQTRSYSGEDDKITIYLQNLIDEFDSNVKVRQCQFLPFSSPSFEPFTTDNQSLAPA